MPSFVIHTPKGKKVDVTEKIKKATSEDDVKKVLVDVLKEGKKK
tara:strand:- start:22515 stop:22646 length:132 start_codon:yes stop_codon:yes gene_type:complete